MMTKCSSCECEVNNRSRRPVSRAQSRGAARAFSHHWQRKEKAMECQSANTYEYYWLKVSKGKVWPRHTDRVHADSVSVCAVTPESEAWQNVLLS